MNRKTLIILVTLLVVGLVYYFLNKKPKGIDYKEIADFAIEDTASIDKIFIADRNNNAITLEKKGDANWIINGNKKADFSKVELLLQTVKNMRVLRPVPEKGHNMAVGDLATTGIKVQFYTKGETIKTIYVGSATQEQNGTYMLIEGSTRIYAVHIPGFFGFLTPRFITDTLTWRDRTVFNYLPNEIKSIEFDYYDKTSGFKIDNTNSKEPVLFNLNNQIERPKDIQFLRFFVASFKQLNFDGYDENQNPKLIDSVLQTSPVCSIQVTDANGKIQKLTLYNKAIDKHTKQIYDEKTGNLLKTDKERFWAFLNDEKSLLLIQQYNFGKIFLTLPSFK
jgi:hypothetical protein